ncbi:DUF2461 family protein [bacterium]|nr:DUF2461 family protein [bacterium]
MTSRIQYARRSPSFSKKTNHVRTPASILSRSRQSTRETPMITPEAFEFMAQLQLNNNKAWFDENRKRYEKLIRDPLKHLALSLSPMVQVLVPSFDGKPKISRINNDIRFHKDRPLYKQHMWIAFGRGPGAPFFVISENGWSAGCMLEGEKQDFEHWRENLVKHTDRWRSFRDAVPEGVHAYLGDNPYKKPLMDSIPDDVFDLVQARQVILHTNDRKSFMDTPEPEIFAEIALMLPGHFFMSTPAADLERVLDELDETNSPPNEDVARVWDAVKSS